MHRFYSLDNWFLDNQLLYHWNFSDYRHFHILFNLNNNLLNNLNKLCLDCVHLLNLLLNDQLLSYDLHLFYLSYDVVDLLNHFNDLWDLFYPLSYLNYRHYLLYNSVNYLVLNLNVILDFASCSILDNLYNLLHYFLHFDYFWYFNYFFYYLLHENWNLDNLFNYFFDGNYLLCGDLNLLIFRLDMIHNSLNVDWHLNLYNFFSNNLHFHYLRNHFLHLN